MIFRSDQANPLPENDALWDATDVARYLKVSRSWVYRAAEAGNLPHLRVGALLRFVPENIRAFARGEQPTEGRVLPFPSR